MLECSLGFLSIVHTVSWFVDCRFCILVHLAFLHVLFLAHPSFLLIVFVVKSDTSPNSRIQKVYIISNGTYILITVHVHSSIPPLIHLKVFWIGYKGLANEQGIY